MESAKDTGEPRTASGSHEPAAAEATGSPGLVVTWTGGQPALCAVAAGGAPIAIRRGAIGDRPLEDSRVSKDHALLGRSAGRWVLEDGGSRNGTFVDGVRIRGEIRFDRASVIRTGDTLSVPVLDVRPYAQARVVTRGPALLGPALVDTWRALEDRREERALGLVGEPGTGRKLLARLLHERIGGDAPMVTASGAAITSSAALSRKLSAAAGGTLCVEGIEELAPELQRTLAGLRATGPRLLALAATLDERLLPELRARLGEVITVPPLRGRPLELAWLLAAALGKSSPALAAHVSLVEACLGRPWPGNVTELEGALADARTRALTAKSALVRARHLAAAAGMLQLDIHLPRRHDALLDLPPRQREVLTALLAGRSEKEVAAAIGLSLHTVHEYVKVLYRKLQVRSRSELLARFVPK